MDPIDFTKIIDDDFIHLSFSWALCLRQLAFLIPALVVLISVRVIAGFNQKRLDIENTIEEERARLQARARQEEREKEQQRRAREIEAKIAERKKKIESALSNRNESTAIKSCKSCGAVFGSGTTCQYCGQP